MTGDIVNLRRARKAKARAESANEAATNRARFGRSRLERSQAEAAAASADRHLDGHRLSDGTSRPPAEDDDAQT